MNGSNQVVVVWGRASACLRELPDRLRAAGVRVVDVAALDASRCRSYTERGVPIPDEAWCEAIHAALPDAAVALVGVVRDATQLRLLHSRVRRPIVLVHLDLSVARIDAERAGLGQPPVEVAHPGVTVRWQSLLDELIVEAREVEVPVVTISGESFARAAARIRELLDPSRVE